MFVMMSALPYMSTIGVITTCRFAKPIDKVPSGDADVVVVSVLGYIESTAGCRPAASLCYVTYSFPSKQIK